MILLPNNCRAGKFSVFPNNWKTIKANAKLSWRISYWFYDDNLKKQKKIAIKGMNHLETAALKKEATQVLIDQEKDLLIRQGYNPITNQYAIIDDDAEISEYTPFLEALKYAYENLKVEHNTKIDIKSSLKYIEQAAKKLCYDRLPIKDVRRKHLIRLLEKTGEIKKQIRKQEQELKPEKKLPDAWTANTFNYYRTALSILYRPLVKMEVVEVNLVLAIEKEKKLKKIRETLSKEERKIVNDHILKLDYNFWRFMQIFFHSGSRITELIAIKKNFKNVDIENQRFKVSVKKGRKYQEEWRAIKTTILPLWQEIYALAKNDQYIFSEGLIPGIKLIRREQVTRRWRRHVKHKLGITADFYSLKHSNLDDIAELEGIRSAQAAAGHSTPVITMNYATQEKERQMKRIKDIGNSFS